MLSYITHFKRAFIVCKIGNRITLYILSICMLLAILTVSVVSLYEYEAEKSDLVDTANALVFSAERSLIAGLQKNRFEGVSIIEDGMDKLPFIKAVFIENERGNRYQYGAIDSRYFALTKDIVADDKALGFLTLYIDNGSIRSAMVSKLKIIILVSILVFGCLGLLFSYVLNATIVRHIKKIATLATVPSRLNAKSYIPIRIPRKRVPDEITALLDALNYGQRKYKELAIEKASYESLLSFQANYDSLTNLPNRRHFNDYLEKQLGNMRSGTGPASLALLFIDLDGFKNINDGQGHDVGDSILKKTAIRFGQTLSTYDSYISRFGGDEFIAILENHDRETVEKAATQIINSLAEPFTFEDKKMSIGCSIGITYALDHGSDAKELIDKADSVMYQAKDAGRNTYVVFDPKMMEQVIFENKIKQKLQSSNLDELLAVYFQPLVNLNSMKVIGFEALVRWFDDDLGFIPPDVFIAIAEKSGLAFKIDSWVFSKAIKQVDLWRAKYNEDFIVAINFSPTNFHDNQFNDWLDNNPVFKNYLDWVELEVTERLMLADDNVAVGGIHRLMEAGIKFSIDDFGTGYSSLGYIKKFKHILSKIKIDRMFINELLNDDADKALVRSIVTMAESLSIEVLAEGIETEDQEKMLMELGCEFGQGYFYSKPIPVSDMDELLLVWNRDVKSTDEPTKNIGGHSAH